jgi:1-acyl-sn-glycerol-3-phosphate acyltransferase
VDRLKDDKAVVIFPEGQVNQDQQDTILTFKSGAVLMAQRAKAPILPMYIVKRKKWYQRQRILVGQPVNLGEILSPMPSMQEISQASELLRDKEVQLRQYYESLPVSQKHNPQTAPSESEERSVNV